MKSVPPRERGFAAGLWGKAIGSHPLSYTPDQVAAFRAGHRDGSDEAIIRRRESKAIRETGYQPGMIGVKERNGKIVMYTFEQYQRREERMRRYGAET